MTASRNAVCSILLLVATLAACGGGGGDAVSKGGATSPSLSLQWPDGYTYDPATHELYGPDDRSTAATAPNYVTEVTLVITGEGLASPVTYVVPLDTLTITYALPPGPKVFTVTVRTIYGTTFTASATGDLQFDLKLDIKFDLAVNAPPTIESLTAGSEAPKSVGVPVTAVVTDPDGNPITYSWSAEGGAIVNGTGSVVTITASKKGTYAVTLNAEDNRGGRTAASVNVTLTNRPPTVSRIIMSPVAPTAGETLTLTCDAIDPDNDPMTYRWYGATTFTGSGRVVTTVAEPGATTYTCDADDGDGGLATVSTSVTVSDIRLAATWKNTPQNGCDVHNVYKMATTVGGRYTLSCTVSANFAARIVVTNYDVVVAGGITGSISNSMGNAGTPWSANFTLGVGTYYIGVGGTVTPGESYSCTLTPTTGVTITYPAGTYREWSDPC